MPRIVDHEQQRQEFLAGALKLFARHGYAGVTMRQVAAELGVSTGTLYHYFSGKHDLFAQIFFAAHQGDADRIADAMPEGADLQTRLHVLASYVHARREELHSALVLAVDALRDPDPAPAAAARVAARGYQAALAVALRVEEVAAGRILRYIVGDLLNSVIAVEPPDRGELAASLAALLA